MTVQDIREKTFEKAVIGGYDMGAVDDFLNEAATGFAELQKENATLKAKMKVLVDKIEEYRSTEDAMRLALLSAQKMSVQIENEAKEKAESLTAESERYYNEKIAAADAEAERILGDAKRSQALEEGKAASAKQATANLVERIRSACLEQIAMLDKLDELELPEPNTAAPAIEESAPAIDEVFAAEGQNDTWEEIAAVEESARSIEDSVKSIEDSVARQVEEAAAEEPEIDIESAMAVAQETAQEAVEEPTRLYGAVPLDDGLEETVRGDFNSRIRFDI